jgi:hypothetical protein
MEQFLAAQMQLLQNLTATVQNLQSQQNSNHLMQTSHAEISIGSL